MTKSSLSKASQHLLETAQALNFGEIQDLQLTDGEPIFVPPPRLVRDIRIGGENGPRLEVDRQDFLLKESMIEFFDHLRRIGNGHVRSIHVRHGLPFRLIVEEQPGHGAIDGRH